jgi:hypothetical protein
VVHRLASWGGYCVLCGLVGLNNQHDNLQRDRSDSDLNEELVGFKPLYPENLTRCRCYSRADNRISPRLQHGMVSFMMIEAERDILEDLETRNDDVGGLLGEADS